MCMGDARGLHLEEWVSWTIDPVDSRGKPGDNVESGCAAGTVGSGEAGYAILSGRQAAVVQGFQAVRSSPDSDRLETENKRDLSAGSGEGHRMNAAEKHRKSKVRRS